MTRPAPLRRAPAPVALAALAGALLSPSAGIAAQPGQAALRAGLHEPGLAERVVIRRTGYGVPHILADDLRAAAFAMAWAQLEDHGARVLRGLASGRGELGRLIPADSVDVDEQARNRIGHRRAVEAFPRLDPDARDVYEGFAAGVNRYVELNPAEVPEGVRPDFTGMDVLALEVSVPGPGGARGVLSRLDSLEEAASDPFPAGASPVLPEDAAPGPGQGSGETGSNAWALAPSRTESGNAILVRNPHLSWAAGYHEAHVRVPGVLDFYGDFRVGGPFGIIGGFNRRLGWATTNNYPDLEEVYALDARPAGGGAPVGGRVEADATEYFFDGAWLPVRVERVDVPLTRKGRTVVEEREVLLTHLGPVVRARPGRIWVLRAAGDGEWRVGTQFLRMMRARDFAEWKDAMRLRARVASNFTYADADGTIAYLWNAGAPDLPHAPGGDTVAIPARSSEDVWTAYAPFDALPLVVDPPSGFLHNENDPFHYTDPGAPLDAADFPPSWPRPRLRLRSQHSVDLLRGGERLSLEEVVRLKHSDRMLLSERVKGDLVAALERAGLEGEVARAADLVAGWDGRVAVDSRGAVLFAEWWHHYLEGAEPAPSSAESAGFRARAGDLFARPWSPDEPLSTPRGLADPGRAVRAFRAAVEETERRWGSWDVAWGEVHRVRVGEADLPASGCDGLLGCFRVLWFAEDDDGLLRVRGGDGWVLAVEFSDPPRAYSVLAYGQSGREGSPHRSDQAGLFARGEMKPVAFTEADIEASLVRRYRPGSGR